MSNNLQQTRIVNAFAAIEQYDRYVQDTREDKPPLPDDVAQRVKRWHKADEIIEVYGPGQKGLRHHAAFFGMSLESSRNDFDCALYVFGSTPGVEKARKSYFRTKVIENITGIYQRAVEAGNDELALKAMGQLGKLLALDKEDPEIPDFSQIQPPVLVLTSDPSVLDNPLPDNYEAQVAQIIARKRGNRGPQNLLEEANVVE